MRWVAGPFRALAISLLACSTAAAGNFDLGSGATLDLDGAALDLGCSDLGVAGTLSAGSAGFSQARDFDIFAGGVVNAGSGVLEVTGDWSNAGTFNRGTGTVRLADGCGLTSAVVSGNTGFTDLELTTAIGFVYSFASGSITKVSGTLTLQGASSNLLTIRSTTPGSEALFSITQATNGSFVDVEDNHAFGPGITLAPGSVVGSNTQGWTVVAAVPALGGLALATLAGGLLLGGRAALERRRARRGS